MKGKLQVILALIVLSALLVPSLVQAQDTTGGGQCVIIQGPSRTPLGFTGPEVTVGGAHGFHFTGPQIHFTELSGGPLVILPAVQAPPDPC